MTDEIDDFKPFDTQTMTVGNNWIELNEIKRMINVLVFEVRQIKSAIKEEKAIRALNECTPGGDAI